METAFGNVDSSSSKTWVRETVEDVLKLPCRAIEDRGIYKKTAEHFGVRVAVDECDGKTPIAIYFPYTDKKGEIVGFKKRDLTIPKKQKYHFTAVGRIDAECQLFGTVSANKKGGKKVIITEGEFDAMIVWQSMKMHTKGSQIANINPTVLSIGLGTANALKHIAHKDNLKFIKKFPEIVLAFDNDRATLEEKKDGIKKGVEATMDIHGLIPEILVAALPEDSDPCDMYHDVGYEQLYWAVTKPIRYTPEGFVQFIDIRESAIEMPILGRPWPWETVTKKTLGRREGEGIYIGAGVKMGKSTFVDKIIEHITQNEFELYELENGVEGVDWEYSFYNKLNGEVIENPIAMRNVGYFKAKLVDGEKVGRKVAVFKFEEQPAETLKKVAGKMYKKDFSNPEKIVFIGEDGSEFDVWGNDIPAEIRENFFTQDDLEKAVDSIGDQIVLYNNYGRCEWDELKGAIRHAVLVEHVRDIIIDPITRLTAGMSPSDANTELERFADEISKMAQDLGFTYYCFCHLKAPEHGGKPHEEGGRVKSNQFRGSRAMMQACFYMLGLEGNKSPDVCERVQNTRYLIVLDDRKYGRTARIALFYDVDTGDFIEPPEGFLDQEDDPDTIQTIREWNATYPSGFNVDSF